MANLVIVESPSKASTIKGYLGSNYKVVASKGHVRDLPKSTLGVDIENNFDAHYINIRGKGDLIREIRKEAKAANKIFLATDPDREGEAISWHLAEALGIPVEKTLRVTFNEITKTAVKSAIKAPRQIDMNLVNSQQARRILDRIVGYKLSPFLWKNVRSGLSAGRVQSVATRIIVEREEEIRNFVPEEYWTVDALLQTKNGKEFSVRFYGDREGKVRLGCEEDAMKVVNAVNGTEFSVDSVKKSKKKKLPAPPFTTSTMQQEAARKLGFQSQRIMRIAQELYEGVNVGSENGGVQGLITYMRTDSLRVSADAQAEAREYIGSKYGDKYNSAAPRVYKAKAGAQDAHEAIRPSRVTLEPAMIKKYVTPDQFKLYKLIWERFVASQMESATLSTVSADFESKGYIFRSSGYTVDFPGYMAVYEESEDDTGRNADELSEQKNIRLPDVKEGEKVSSLSIDPAKHFTEAPPRYNDASLIKFLEEMGIGRPSTFAT
ncbi:MAG: type I DNA topoisomerase, partial [Clostridia bacterium]|nr:type I DNA topoisomerase [Clostridia bacterium]